MLPYIMYAVVIFGAISITLFACVRWIFVKTNWHPVDATIEGTQIVVIPEGGSHLLVNVTYIFDDMLYRGTMNIVSFDPDDYVEGSTISVLVNPQRPDRFNRDKNYRFQETSIAKWLGKQVRTQSS
ncbi:DUF3592 domain-containing protein [Pararhizobium sp. BT-229]|uniref:DUF3592 domain-containing protein n=1 Tax=Pararhizobium sp. BT-229 TaxID=2986923 RepID=UPI0021F6A468|nr:DUF3592 domain-containing protein [Pararhizobium sp. BT-229]MCV9962406.1 DUF3592 domain-containing protein [Pararhizobium sp. BT-229]